MPEITRDNHYVPQAILKRWSTDGKHVCAYRLLVSNLRVPYWKKKSIDKLAFQRDLYTTASGSKEEDEFEKWVMREIEDPAFKSIEKLIDGGRLSPDDWRKMIRFVAIQDIRTPLAYKEFLDLCEKHIPPMIEKNIQEATKKVNDPECKVETSSSQSRNFAGALSVSYPERPGTPEGQTWVRVEVTAGRPLWIDGMRVLEGATDVLCKHRWSVVSAYGDLVWPLTDHPVLRLRFNSLDDYNFKGGWGQKGTEIMMPISPKHLLYVRVGSKSPNRFTFNEPQTRAVQEVLIGRAHRWIFSPKPEDWIVNCRPRTVNEDQFKIEKEAWENWHKKQLELHPPNS